jgi:hypothetical protein
MAESKKAPASKAKAATTDPCDDSGGEKAARATGASGGAVYGLGFIGAAVYYIQESTGFGEGVVAFLKAIVWPAFVVYDLLKHMA